MGRFAKITRLMGLLEAFGGIGDMGTLLRLAPGWLSDLGSLATAENSRDYHRVAIGLLRPIAPLTSSDIDDGVLIMVDALGQSDDWHAWVDNRLELGSELGDMDYTEIPEGALASTYALRDLLDLPPDVDAIRPIPKTHMDLLSFAPLFLEIVRELKRIAPEFRSSPAAA